MIQTKSKQTSNMLVLSNSPNNTALLKSILSIYFHFGSENILHLITKYYKANIQIRTQEWPAAPHANQIQKQGQKQINEDEKQDLLIMLVSQQQTFEPEVYDYIITKYNPDNFILIVNMACRDSKWKDEDVIASKVNNFIQVIKENLHDLNTKPPKREKSGLLADNFQEGSIFSLLELIQTTQWSYIQRIQQSKKNKNQEFQKIQSQEQQTNPATIIKKEQLIKQTYFEAQSQKNITDQDLQEQMLSFQSMMNDMLRMKQMSRQPQGVADNERKQKAQELINKLLKGNFM